ncbi:MAG: hypothetical protein L0Y58_21730, partial [Verrucomicrobia subdivision 3 bacterium]|nr:hypothetical protein [Limisphaerales bacterium]
MKNALLLAIGAAVAISGSAQDVFVLGGPGTTPVPPIVYQPPIYAGNSAATYQPVEPVAPVYASSVYSTSVYPTAPCYSYNSGYYNSGYYNSGYYNSGYYNSG